MPAETGQQQSLMNALGRAEYFRGRLAVTAEAYRSIDQAKCQALFAQFHAKVTGGAVGELPAALEEDSERLEPLTGVKAFPVRVKCATLPWHTFEAALKSGLAGAVEPVKTE